MRILLALALFDSAFAQEARLALVPTPDQIRRDWQQVSAEIRKSKAYEMYRQVDGHMNVTALERELILLKYNKSYFMKRSTRRNAYFQAHYALYVLLQIGYRNMNTLVRDRQFQQYVEHESSQIADADQVGAQRRAAKKHLQYVGQVAYDALDEASRTTLVLFLADQNSAPVLRKYRELLKARNLDDPNEKYRPESFWALAASFDNRKLIHEMKKIRAEFHD